MQHALPLAHPTWGREDHHDEQGHRPIGRIGRRSGVYRWPADSAMAATDFISYGPSFCTNAVRSNTRWPAHPAFSHACDYQIRLSWGKYTRMGTSLPTLRRATERDHDVIIGLIDEAADWLRTKKTDQWTEPWPSEEDRRHRIMRDLQAGKTWIAWDGNSPVATLTADSQHSHQEDPVWPHATRQDKAVYVCRLVVSRGQAGQGLGAELLDWAGLNGMQAHGADWVRVDVWTTNEALHAYYRRQGFKFYGYSEKADDYPSAALFQKPTDRIQVTNRALFQVESEPDY